MVIEVLRIGQRLVRDDRVTTHVALVSRAFGADRIFMDEVNPEIRETIRGINHTWGGGFEVEIIDGWRSLLREKKKTRKIIHLTMYGQGINDVAGKLRGVGDVLVVVGAEKVPREVYEIADYNVSIGGQPHSEISALAVLLDRIQDGGQFARKYAGAKRTIVPTGRGKKVVET